MLVNQDTNNAKYQIQSYSCHKNKISVTINQHIYTQSIFIHDNTLISPWRPGCFADIELSDFESLFNNPPSIFLLGTGPSLQIPDMALLRPLFEKGIGVEFMDTLAAIRSYSALSAEGRSVSMGLMLSEHPPEIT